MNKEITRLFDFLHYQSDHCPQEVCLAKKMEGKWLKYSTKEIIKEVNELSAGLLKSGVNPGDKIAIASTTNRPEWNIVDLASLQIGAIDVPVYPTISEKDYIFIFNEAEIKWVFVSDEGLYKKMKSIQSDVPTLKHIYTFDQVKDASHWSEVKNKVDERSLAEIEKLKAAVKNEDLATIIYTSGTTGLPKGVMLSHNNIVSNALASAERLPIEPGARALSFLPLCHSFERMLIYLYMYKCVNVYYAENMETIGDDMRDIKPNIFTAVPRLLEKVFDKIIAKGNELSGLKKKLFFWAVRLAENYEMYNRSFIYNLKLKLARKVIFSKWQAALGGEVRIAASGSAALSERLSRIFNGAGIPIMEGYGLTETSPVISVNEIKEDGFRFGTTGRTIRGVQVKIAEDGEILTKGPNLMMGYYKRPEITAEVIDVDGWFHTGDIGVMEEGQYLKITDRKKEIFKTSGGKYIAPQPMENVYKQSRYIEQIMVIGENQKHTAALIVPNEDGLKEYCMRLKLANGSMEEMIKRPEVLELIKQEIEKYNGQFGHWEQVKKFELLPQQFSIEADELTPTLKLKRKVIMDHYNKQVEAIYS